jgi:hypothetical protein
MAPQYATMPQSYPQQMPQGYAGYQQRPYGY